MKISDPVGKVYTHTMFKKKKKTRRREFDDDEDDYDQEDRVEEVMEEESEESEEVSEEEPSEDSLSTRSSRMTHHSHHRRRHRSSSHGRKQMPKRGVSKNRGEERDRGEDAISLGSRRGRRQTALAQVHHASQRSKRSMGSVSSNRQLKDDPLTPNSSAGSSYNLWSSRNSLKRDHRRKFNRSLCGILLGTSIVLVILGILGIIGIAVYLGVAQKLDDGETALISVDGSMRVTSDDFKISLLNPESAIYQIKASKYSKMISATYRESFLKEAFVKTIIDGFSSGSLIVFFKVIFNKNALPEKVQKNPIKHIRDIFVQEIMQLSGGQFDQEEIDIDNVVFEISKVQDQIPYLEPEPYQAKESLAKEENKTMWQSLMDRSSKKDEDSANIVVTNPGKHGMMTTPGIKKEISSSEERMPMLQVKPGQNIIHSNAGRVRQLHNPTLGPNIPHMKEKTANPSLKFDKTVATLEPTVLKMSPSVPNISSLRNSQKTNSNEENNRRMDEGYDSVAKNLMSAFLEPPPPPRRRNDQKQAPQNAPQIWNPSKNFVPSLPGPSTPHPKQDIWHHQPSSPVPHHQRVSQPVTSGGLHPHSNPPPQHYPTFPIGQRKSIDTDEDSSVMTTNTQNGLYQSLLGTMMPKSTPKDSQNTRKDKRTDQIALRDSHGGFWSTLRGKNIHEIGATQESITSKRTTSSKGNAFPTSSPKPRILHLSELGQLNSNEIITPTSVSVEVLPEGSNSSESFSKVVEGNVPFNKPMDEFSIGSSLTVAPKDEQNIKTHVNNAYRGEDSNIIPSSQIPSGIPLEQGPLGPILKTPRPNSFTVSQTPTAPNLSAVQVTSANRNPAQFSGPGNYVPPIQSTPKPLRGTPGSGQMLLKSLIEQRKHMQQKGANQQRQTQEPGNLLELYQNLDSDELHMLQKQFQNYHQSSNQPQQSEHPIQKIPYFAQQHNRHASGTPVPGSAIPRSPRPRIPGPSTPVPGSPRPGSPRPPQRKRPSPWPFMRQDQPHIQRRQDLGSAVIPAAAVGAISAGLTPMTIFSNLLNAYATIDSKHDITDKLVKSAASWLGVDQMSEESMASRETPISHLLSTSTTSTTSTTTTASTTTKPTTTMTTTTTTSSSYSPYNAIVVDANGLPPVKSNVNPSQPLRKKPPSEGAFRVTPAPGAFGGTPMKFGVSNPYYFSEDLPQATEAYGPTDFVVETVKLDKSFLHQFFTSKPMLLGTDVVTSTSVKVKKGRDSSSEDDLMFDDAYGEVGTDQRQQSIFDFKEQASEEDLKNLFKDIDLGSREDYSESSSTQRSTSLFPVFTTTTTTTTTTPITTTTRQLPKQSKLKKADTPIIIDKNVHKFQRYQIPPEVKVTHQMTTDHGGPRNARKDKEKEQ